MTARPSSKAAGRVALIAAGLAGLGLPACSVPPPTPAAERLAPEAQASGTLGPYVLQPGDDIEITFPRTPELNARQIIRPDGLIALPAAAGAAHGALQAAGATPEALEARVAGAYAAELKSPEVRVLIRTFGSNTVFVTGEVNRPGAVALAGSMTALQAVLAAEGFKSSARARQVLLIRPGSGGAASWRLMNFDKAFERADLGDDVPLAPHDIVYVPRSRIGAADEAVDLYIRRLLPVQPGLTVPVS